MCMPATSFSAQFVWLGSSCLLLTLIRKDFTPYRFIGDVKGSRLGKAFRKMISGNVTRKSEGLSVRLRVSLRTEKAVISEGLNSSEFVL